MIVTVTDLFDGVTPETSPVTITVVEGSATGGGGGGAVDSVNGHVGVVVLDADDFADGTTNHVFTAADDTKLAGIATGATANDTDANLKARANHTGSQAISTVTGLQTALDGKDTALAAHEADTTAVHGIADTSALETTTGSAAKVATHAGLSDPHPGYLTPAEGDAAYQPLDADLTTVAALDSTTAGALVTDGSGWIRKTYAQLKTALSLVKADVGLGSVDNTSDAAKPVSTAQQTALDLKANLASPALTGNPTAPTPSAADNDTSIATTAFVQGEITAKAPLASPTFTGDPTAPTASPGDNDTSIATTAFVTAAVAAGGGFTNTVLYAAASGTLTLTSSAQDVAGATVSPTVASTSDVYLVTAFFDFDVTSASVGQIGVGTLTVDGVDQTGIATFDLRAVQRGTAGQQWRVTGLTAGARVFKLRASKTSAGGAVNVNATHTTIVVQRIS